VDFVILHAAIAAAFLLAWADPKGLDLMGGG
jgi:hypothetical protein